MDSTDPSPTAKENLERITLYLGYKATGRARRAFLEDKARELGCLTPRGDPSISGLFHAVISATYPTYPK